MQAPLLAHHGVSPQIVSMSKAKRRIRNRIAKQSGGALASPPNTKPQTLPLMPWEVEFAEWLVTQHKRPLIKDQLAKCEELLKAVGAHAALPYTRKDLKNLRQRDEFKAFFADLQKDALKRARAKIEMRVPEYIDAHKKGLDMALEAHDHRSIPNYTNPILDRIWPRNDQQTATAAVVIELSPKQIASINDPPPTVEYEVLTDDDE